MSMKIYLFRLFAYNEFIHPTVQVNSRETSQAIFIQRVTIQRNSQAMACWDCQEAIADGQFVDEQVIKQQVERCETALERYGWGGGGEMQGGDKADSGLDGAGNDAVNAALESGLDDVLPCAKTACKLGLDDQDVSRRAVKDELGALQAVQRFVNCDWDVHFLRQRADSREFEGLGGVLDIVYVVWD